MTIARNEYSVYQFFTGDHYEAVCQNVSSEEAGSAALHYCHSVAAKLGIVNRVIITDGGDCTVFEWKYGEGVTWPKKPADTITSPLPNPFGESQ